MNRFAWLPVLGCLWFVGCFKPFTKYQTPTEDGLNTGNLIDPPAQELADQLFDTRRLFEIANEIREIRKPTFVPPKRDVLVLSGGGSYGAYSAGVLYGWTGRGDRPKFDVVTGISTGALIAPFAFLGSAYDEDLKKFYTTLETKNIYRLKPFWGLLTESLADTKALNDRIHSVITPEFVAAIGAEHRKGRRLYVGTTEVEGKRFICWDIGEIACRNTPADRELITQILLGSSAIPGFFPPSRIPVEVDGKSYVERHVDGGVSVSLFFRPPYVPPDHRQDSVANCLYNTDVYAIVAGKLWADPEVLKPKTLTVAGTSVSTLIYAQTRGDLSKLYLTSVLTGMRYHLTSIPLDFEAPKSATDFIPAEMTRMFDEGVRQIQHGTAWRSTPPGVEQGETVLERARTRLTFEKRVPPSPIGEGTPMGQRSYPVGPTPVEK